MNHSQCHLKYANISPHLDLNDLDHVPCTGIIHTKPFRGIVTTLQYPQRQIQGEGPQILNLAAIKNLLNTRYIM